MTISPWIYAFLAVAGAALAFQHGHVLDISVADVVAYGPSHTYYAASQFGNREAVAALYYFYQQRWLIGRFPPAAGAVKYYNPFNGLRVGVFNEFYSCSARHKL